MGVSKTIQQGCHYEGSTEHRILKIFRIHNIKKTFLSRVTRHKIRFENLTCKITQSDGSSPFMWPVFTYA